MKRLAISLFLTALCWQGAAAAEGWQEPKTYGPLTRHVYQPRSPVKAVAVVMHGCAQTARPFAENAGWTKVAEDLGLLIIAPEFVNGSSNNCFNWHNSDGGRQGQVDHLVRMIKDEAGAKPPPIFVTGLSAGAGMAAVLLAQAPSFQGVELIGGGLVAGPAYGCTDMSRAPFLPFTFSAFECMDTKGIGFWAWAMLRTESGKQKMADKIGTRDGKPLVLTIWHADNDSVVDRVNSDAAFDQWVAALGLSTKVVGNPVHSLPASYEYKLAEDHSKGLKVEQIVFKKLDQQYGHAEPVNISHKDSYVCGLVPTTGSDVYYADSNVCGAYWIARNFVK